MELSHRFTVPIGVEETWAHFNDIASVAECFPGAQVTEADEQSFSGSVKVKLGPIALQYNGSGTFVEKDAEGRTVNRCEGIAFTGGCTDTNEFNYLVVKTMRSLGVCYLENQARV